MLESMGLPGDDIERVYEVIPEKLRATAFELPEGRSEYAVDRECRSLAAANASDIVPFLGGGYYDHFIPSAVDEIASRSEFYTAYTPYQAEASQGTLQAIYEFQSCVAGLTSLDVANASLYDGGTAVYEAVMMAARVTRNSRVVVDECVSPIYREMLYCYTANLPVEVVEVPRAGYQTDHDGIKNALDDDTAAVVVQYPNFFGSLDDFEDVVQACHDKGGLAVAAVYPVAMGLIKSPGEMGFDIAVGEGQSLGLPLSFGGPYAGFMATRKKYLRRMPGRLSGATVDRNGKRAFVMTLQSREQHIRRDKATSNICTNQALCALRNLLTMGLLGDAGLRAQAQRCLDKAAYAKQTLEKCRGVNINTENPTFNEFVVELPQDAETALSGLLSEHIAGGLPLGRFYPGMENMMLVAVTEKRSKEEIDRFAEVLEGVLWS